MERPASKLYATEDLPCGTVLAWYETRHEEPPEAPHDAAVYDRNAKPYWDIAYENNAWYRADHMESPNSALTLKGKCVHLIALRDIWKGEEIGHRYTSPDPKWK